MSRHNKNKLKKRNILFDICHYAAEALGISEGEFWVWYGSPFILQKRSDD